MPYVERDGSNNVVGMYARPQPSIAEERLADDHADVVNFRNRPAPAAPLTADEVWDSLKQKSLVTDADLKRR